MSDWKRKQFRCEGCGQWHDANHMSIHNPKCTGGCCTAGGGELWVDMDTLQQYCTGCKKTWPLEDGEFHCTCGQVTKTHYRDAAVVVQAQAGFIADNGQQAYVVTQTDTTAVGHRQFTNVRVR